jgi:hypothetical protein
MSIITRRLVKSSVVETAHSALENSLEDETPFSPGSADTSSRTGGASERVHRLRSCHFVVEVKCGMTKKLFGALVTE